MADFFPFHALTFPLFKQLIPLSTINEILQDLNRFVDFPAVFLLWIVVTWMHDGTMDNAQIFISQNIKGFLGAGTTMLHWAALISCPQ